MQRDSLNQIIEAARDEGRTVLTEPEGYALLEAAGLKVPQHRVVASGAAVDADTLESFAGDAVVLKVVSPDVLHKSDVGGVRVVPREVAAVAAGVDAILSEVGGAMPQADLRGVMIAEKVAFRGDTPGTELLLSVRRDRAFGPVVMCGPGGVLTEWYGELSGGASHTLFSAQDFDVDRALECLLATPMGRQALRPSRLFDAAPFSADALASVLSALAELAGLESAPRLPLVDEIELNPVVAVDGTPIALDAVVRVGTPLDEPRRPRPLEKIHPLLHPRSAAVYGASSSSMNAGRIILRNLKQAEGIEYGRLYAVHPTAERIDGVRCYASTADLPEPVDLAVISIPAQAAPAAIAEIADTGKAQSIILIPGGFAESGGHHLADAIKDTLAASREREDRGPVLVGGNCLGIVSKREYNTFFLPTYKLPFHDARGSSLALISQSGAYIVTFTSNLDGVVFPRASISYGNEMDLTVCDFFEYYLEHEAEPRVFGFYIEGFQPGEGERFLSLVRRAKSEGKAVVVYKAGRTEVGARAAASHTASVAGDYRVGSSLLREAGAAVCDTLNMFEDTTKVLTMLRGRRSAGKRVGVISNAGFECSAVSDHLFGLELAAFSDATRSALEGVLPPIAHCGNPIDCTPMTDTKHFVEAVRIMAAAPEVDLVLVSAVPATPALDILAPDPAGTHRENAFGLHALPAELGRVFAECEKPMTVAIDSGRLYDPGVLMLERAGVPVFRKIDRASRALAAFLRHGS